MKIRNSFVGNSSTCSFIAVVFKIAEDEHDFEERVKDNIPDVMGVEDLYQFQEIIEPLDLTILHDPEQGVSEGVYIGKELISISDETAEEEHIPYESFAKFFDIASLLELHQKFKDLAGELEILISTRMC